MNMVTQEYRKFKGYDCLEEEKERRKNLKQKLNA